MLTQHNVMGDLPSNYIWRRWVWGCWCCSGLLVGMGYKTARYGVPIVGLHHNEGELWATASSASFAGWSSPRASSLAKVVVTA